MIDSVASRSAKRCCWR